MEPDYAKAAAEIIAKLRRSAAAEPLPQPPATGITGWTIINAPRDCTIYITPLPPAPPQPD